MLVQDDGVLGMFRGWLPATGRALHLGSLRSNPEISTLARQKSWFPPGWSHEGHDLAPGLDVDLVGDVHALSVMPLGGFYDALVCCSVLEHLESPWLAAESMASVTKPGGLIFVQTHQTFPLHGYPSDFYRFSREALASLFGPRHGWASLATAYEYPCKIIPPAEVTEWNTADDVEAFLNVSCIARRI